MGPYPVMFITVVKTNPFQAGICISTHEMSLLHSQCFAVTNCCVTLFLSWSSWFLFCKRPTGLSDFNYPFGNLSKPLTTVAWSTQWHAGRSQATAHLHSDLSMSFLFARLYFCFALMAHFIDCHLKARGCALLEQQSNIGLSGDYMSQEPLPVSLSSSLTFTGGRAAAPPCATKRSVTHSFLSSWARDLRKPESEREPGTLLWLRLVVALTSSKCPGLQSAMSRCFENNLSNNEASLL